MASAAAATITTTVTLDAPSSSNQQQHLPVLVLKLKRPKVSWKEGTVDNEFMNNKSSKKCCIFHKEKPFDKDDSDSEGDCEHNNGENDSDKTKRIHGGDGNCCQDY